MDKRENHFISGFFIRIKINKITYFYTILNFRLNIH